MARILDSAIAYRVLKLLTTPFNETDAFKLGIIDSSGKELKKMSQLHTQKEQAAYTVLHRMVFRIKRIIEKVPLENKKLLSYAAALSLIKEHIDSAVEPVNLEVLFVERTKADLTEEIDTVNTVLDPKRVLSFRTFAEDAPANNAQATPGIDGLSDNTVVVRKKKKLFRRSEVLDV